VYETELIAGSPTRVLQTVADTRHAGEIVIGTRGFGPVRALLGSVAHELLYLARCPVTVVPARAPDTTDETAAEHAQAAMPS
jgi:nucleotide-binding universal stress UspA family protein